jgi:hypothetical protein
VGRAGYTPPDTGSTIVLAAANRARRLGFRDRARQAGSHACAFLPAMKTLAEKTSAKLLVLPAAALTAAAIAAAVPPARTAPEITIHNRQLAPSPAPLPEPPCGADGYRCAVAPA